jgi:hypothetical protein
MGTVGATRQDKAHTRQICRDIDWPVWSRGLFWGIPARVQNKSKNPPPRHRKCPRHTPYGTNDAFMSRLRGPIVASIHTFRSAGVYLQPENRSAALRDVAARVFHFTSVAIVFAFVLILTTGLHP